MKKGQPNNQDSDSSHKKKRGAQLKLPLPLWSYALGIGLMLYVAIWFFVLITLKTINYFDFLEVNGWFVGWKWAGLTFAALGWACINLHWAGQAIRNLDLLSGYSHLAIAMCCGFATLGVHSVSIVHSYHETPFIEDDQQLLPEESLQEDLSGPIYGNVNRGKAWFSLTCVTCHGPTGAGISDLAPSLLDSEFLKTTEPVQVNLMIRSGRAINDPANKSGKPMPARGGDRTLTNEKIADLVAYVMSMHGRTADPQALSWEGVDAPEPELSRATFRIRPQNKTVRSVNLRILLTHGILVFGIILMGLIQLIGWSKGWSLRRTIGWWSVNTWGWWVALISWLMILLIFIF